MSQAEIDGTIEILAKKYEFIFPYLDERSRRIWAAVEADAMGWGGVG